MGKSREKARLLRWKIWIAGGLLLCGSCGGGWSQSASAGAVEPAAKSGAHGSEAVAQVPGLYGRLGGFNAGISYFGVHNSAVGWYSVATPAVSFAFSEHYSADASASIYFRRMVENLNPQERAESALVTDAVDASDTFLSFHATFAPRVFDDTVTASMTLPTGNSAEGLGTGRVAFDFANHAERYVGNVGLQMDLGVGDTSTLSNNIVNKEYSSLGAMAHFQTGAVFWLRGDWLQLLAYEQLPMGSQKVYQSYAPNGDGNGQPVSTTGASEDNGLTAVVGIPLTGRLTALSYYNRSLRHHSDTVSFGLTYVLRSRQKGKWTSLVDEALRAAESGDAK